MCRFIFRNVLSMHPSFCVGVKYPNEKQLELTVPGPSPPFWRSQDSASCRTSTWKGRINACMPTCLARFCFWFFSTFIQTKDELTKWSCPRSGLPFSLSQLRNIPHRHDLRSPSMRTSSLQILECVKLTELTGTSDRCRVAVCSRPSSELLNMVF